MMGKKSPHGKIIGKRKKLEKVWASKISLTETAIKSPRRVNMMPIKMMAGIAGEMNKAGFYSIEVWGGAMFDVATCFLSEDPWDRPRVLKNFAGYSTTDASPGAKSGGLSPLCR
jgi:hypothetical protein